jgi:uncharacterized membrane protein YfcA
MELLGYFSALFIGITLGLIGSGGAILTVPILVYLFGIKPEQATGYSLFIVGFTSGIGAVRHYFMDNLQLKTAVYFVVPSTTMLLLTRKYILPNIPDQLFQIGSFNCTKDLLLVILFSVLMIFASISMIRKSAEPIENHKVNPIQLSVIGFIVGCVSGLLGAGGGFLIIPSLLFFGKLNMKQAVGTSLLIITTATLLGFAGDVVQGHSFDYTLLAKITALALAGLLLGTQLSKKMNSAQLKPIFGWFVLSMGCYIIIKSLFFSS